MQYGTLALRLVMATAYRVRMVCYNHSGKPNGTNARVHAPFVPTRGRERTVHACKDHAPVNSTREHTPRMMHAYGARTVIVRCPFSNNRGARTDNRASSPPKQSRSQYDGKSGANQNGYTRRVLPTTYQSPDQIISSRACPKSPAEISAESAGLSTKVASQQR